MPIVLCHALPVLNRHRHLALQTHESDNRRNLLAVNLSLGVNLVLAGVKRPSEEGHSPALLADGINSTSDVVYLLIIRVFMRLAGKRARPRASVQAIAVREHCHGGRWGFRHHLAIAIFWNAISQVYDLFVGQSEFSGAGPLALWWPPPA